MCVGFFPFLLPPSLLLVKKDRREAKRGVQIYKKPFEYQFPLSGAKGTLFCLLVSLLSGSSRGREARKDSYCEERRESDIFYSEERGRRRVLTVGGLDIGGGRILLEGSALAGAGRIGMLPEGGDGGEFTLPLPFELCFSLCRTLCMIPPPFAILDVGERVP